MWFPPSQITESRIHNDERLSCKSHHHHHHLFLKCQFLPCSDWVDVFPDMRPLHISLNTTHTQCKPSSSMPLLTHSYPSLPTPTRTSHPHHHISTVRHPIISTLKFHMPMPLQSTLPHHLIPALFTQRQIHTAFPIPQRHSAHPSHRHPFRPLQTADLLSSSLRFQFGFGFALCPLYFNTFWTQASHIFPFMRYFI